MPPAPSNQVIPVLPASEGEKNGRPRVIFARDIRKGDFLLLDKSYSVGRWIKVRTAHHHRIEGRLVNVKIEGTSQVGMDAFINLSPEDRVRRIK